MLDRGSREGADEEKGEETVGRKGDVGGGSGSQQSISLMRDEAKENIIPYVCISQYI